jgi:cobalt-zinc-cadmium resistance protein CzcA
MPAKKTKYYDLTKIKSMKPTLKKFIFIACVTSCLSGYAQNQPFTIQQSISTSLQNNPSIKSSGLQIEQQRILGTTYRDFGKTSFTAQYGQANSIKWDTYFTIEQPIPNPSLFRNQKAYYDEKIKGSQLNLAITQNELVYQVKSIYYQLSYFEAAKKLLQSQDSLFAEFLRAAVVRNKTGESNLLEKTTAETQLNEIRNRIQQNASAILIARKQLETYQNSPLPAETDIDTLNKLSVTVQFADSVYRNNPEAAYIQQQINIADRIIGVEKARAKPDFSISYFNQSIIGTQEINGIPKTFGAGKRFQGVAAGIYIPIFNKPSTSRIKAAKVDKQIAETQYDLFKINLQSQYQQATQEYLRNTQNIRYYETSALTNGDLILRQAQIAFKNGEIGYVEFLQALRTYRDIRSEYLNAINELNQSIVRIQYLSGINQ